MTEMQVWFDPFLNTIGLIDSMLENAWDAEGDNGVITINRIRIRMVEMEKNGRDKETC